MESNKTFIIKHKTTGELFQARSGKTSWKAPAHAKNAFNQSLSSWNVEALGLKMVPRPRYFDKDATDTPKFSEQDVYEIVELKAEATTQLEKATLLLQECLGRCDYDIHNKIEEFLKGQNES